MFKLIWEWFGLKWAKGLLDKLPGKGKKTIVSGIVLILTLALSFVPPEYQALIQSSVDFLKESFVTQPVLTSSAIGVAVGLLHKLLNALEMLEERLEIEALKKEGEKRT